MPLLRALFPCIEASFPTPYSPTEAARRLAANVKHRNSYFDVTFEETVMGTVASDHVVLHRHRPPLQNPFMPIFKGCFETRDGETILVGRFALQRLVKVLLAVSLVGAGIVLVYVAGPLLKAFVLLGVTLLLSIMVLMTVTTLLLVAGGHWLARGDVEYISAVIRRSLSRDPGQPASASDE